MREKIILVCTECLSRNYTTSKKKAVATVRMQLSKYCPKCNKKITKIFVRGRGTYFCENCQK